MVTFQLPLFEPSSPRPAKKRDLPSLAAGGKAYKLGKGGRRLYLEGLWLARSGFSPWGGKATVLVDSDSRQVTILLDPELAKDRPSAKALKRAVSGKVKRGKQVPVIDLEGPELDLRKVFGGAEQVVVRALRGGKLVITPAQAEEMRRERLDAPPNLNTIDLYGGCGLMALAAKRIGARSVLAIEHWDEAAEAFARLHHGVPVIEAGVEQVALEEHAHRGAWGLPRTPWLLTAGVPCETYSKMTQKGISVWSESGPRDPHELADQAFWTLVMIMLVNPVNVLIENVPDFLKHAGGFVRALQVLGYHVHVNVMNPADYGYGARRERAVIVATTQPGFSFPQPRRNRLPGQKLHDLLIDPDARILQQLPERQGGWFSVKSPSGMGKTLREWLSNREKWKVTSFEYDSPSVPAITKSMHKTHPQGPYLRHPTQRDLYRLLTVEELRRLHGLTPGEASSLPGQDQYSLATQLYGQAVHVPLFVEVLQRIPRGRPRGPITVQNPWGWM